jgi:hypothetical protein
MARSPQIINPDVGPAAPQQGNLTPQRIDGITGEAFGAGAARAEGEVGRAISGAGDAFVRSGNVLSDMLIQEQALENETNARNTLTAAGTEANEAWAAYSQLQGGAATAGFGAFQENLSGIRERALNQARNSAERRLLERSLVPQMAQVERGAIQWRAQQARVASVASSRAAAALQVNNAVQARDNPADLLAAIRTGEASIRDEVEVSGGSVEVLNQRLQEYRGEAFSRVIATIAETDPLRAAALFRENRNSMDATAAVQIAQRLEGPVRLRVASDMVAEIVGPPRPSARDRIFRAENAAGDSRRNAMGSSASGPGQITDGTWNRYAERLGLTAAQRNDRAAHERIFDEYQRDAQREIGRPLTDGEQYAAWFLGISGAKAFLNAPRDADARAVYTAAAGADTAAQAFRQNPRLLENGMTVGQVLDAVQSRVGPAAGPVVPRAQAMQQIMDRTADDPQLRAVAMSQLATYYSQQDQIHAQERAALAQTAQTTGAALEIGADVPIPAAQIRATFPPEQANRMLDTLYTQQVSGQMYTAIRYAPPQEIAAMQQDIATGSGPFSQTLRQRRGIRMDADGQVIPEDRGEDVAIREALRVQFAERVRVRNENLRADPAQFVAEDPGVRAAAAAQQVAPNDPTTLQGYVTATLAAQERMGLPEEDRRVLSKSVSQDIAARLMRADPADDATTVGAQLQGLSRQYGEHWPRVFGDLVRDGRLPDDYRVLAAIPSPVGQNDYQRMMMAARQLGGMDKMRNSVNPVERTQITRDVDGYVEPFIRTAVAGQSTGGFQLASMVREAVNNMAHFYVMQGQSAATALQTATDRIINDRYEILGTMRVPRTLPDGSPLGIGPVSRAQAIVMRGLTPDTLPDPGGNPQLTPERRREIYAQSAQNGFWVPNQSDDGLVLMATRANGAVLPVRRQDGQMVELRYNALPQPGEDTAVGTAGRVYEQTPGAATGTYARQPGRASGIYAPQTRSDMFQAPARPGAPAGSAGGAGGGAVSPGASPPVGPRPQPGTEPRGAAPRGAQRWRGENAQ